MELLTILLSGLLAIVSPVGLVTDSVAENAIRSRLEKAEQLQVRIDNTPNYQILQGKVERVRVAGRGLWLTPDIRIDVLELESDPIELDVEELRQGEQESPRAYLQQPFQAGVRLVLREADIERALESPTVIARLQQLMSKVPGGAAQRYEFLNPEVDFLENNRLRFQVEAVEGDAQPLTIVLESELGIRNGNNIELVEPALVVNGQALPPQLVAGFAKSLSNRFSFRSLEDAGITTRLLQLEIDSQELKLAAFVRFEPLEGASAPTREGDVP
ncbi:MULTISPECIES: DUF2993 domain-containing protein [unclassified Coleofasciculus]|uniref:LmeA family phospholipid-binding protein n=1 Tax=unclassified Coleofasciculus TaxID=2692782 RepID=UPI001880D7BA|nr:MULTISPECIES: DUF2993 domain-containing protein [unclassified Coleofasciculus]MBE9129982.1 DUF2993 domain-containing protein [Coleofasciculus sp. LEGE 07081]MBE9151207.1 DUF2993 domain-containing protein [Coleofasciculus sp. LEGE 07092]